MIFPESNGPGSLPPHDKPSTIPPAPEVREPGEKWKIQMMVHAVIELDAVDCPTLAEAMKMAQDIAREQPLVVTLAGVQLKAAFVV